MLARGDANLPAVILPQEIYMIKNTNILISFVFGFLSSLNAGLQPSI